MFPSNFVELVDEAAAETEKTDTTPGKYFIIQTQLQNSAPEQVIFKIVGIMSPKQSRSYNVPKTKQ